MIRCKCCRSEKAVKNGVVRGKQRYRCCIAAATSSRATGGSQGVLAGQKGAGGASLLVEQELVRHAGADLWRLALLGLSLDRRSRGQAARARGPGHDPGDGLGRDVAFHRLRKNNPYLSISEHSQEEKSRSTLAEAHGNRTHPRGSSPRAPDLKSGRATSALSASGLFLRPFPKVVKADPGD